jgi:hypothetical protein
MTANSLVQQWHRRLAVLEPEERQRLALAATLKARAAGLAVLREVGDVDIPLTLTPEIVTRETEATRAQDAAAILRAVVRAAHLVLSEGTDSPRARLLFANFGPTERAGLELWREAEDCTIARVDWFLDVAGAHHALELNATIPAMEGYSDAAANAWLEAIGEVAGLSAEARAELVARNGSNAEELRRSIVAHAKDVPAGRPASIAIVHRAGDSQIRELQSLARHFRAAGHEVALAPQEQVSLDTDGAVRVEGKTFDILYRHIFARRMEPGSALAKVALGQARQRLQNPVNGQLEVKGLFAEVSRILEEDGGAGLELSEADRLSLSRVLPWTRLLAAGPVRGPDGTPVADLVAWVEAHPDALVLKRSWDYGGKSVHLGREVVSAEGLAGWKARVDSALAEGPGAFVVQRRIDSPRRPHLVVGAGGAVTEEEVFVDASSYTATGDRDVPGGGVVRFARVGIVNIVGGGGVAPLVRADVAADLLTAWDRRRG